MRNLPEPAYNQYMSVLPKKIRTKAEAMHVMVDMKIIVLGFKILTTPTDTILPNTKPPL